MNSRKDLKRLERELQWELARCQSADARAIGGGFLVWAREARNRHDRRWCIRKLVLQVAVQMHFNDEVKT
jgi:hypothetical protein